MATDDTVGYPDAIGRAWVCYEALRKLGFDGAWIRVGTGRVDGRTACLVRVALTPPAPSPGFDIDADVWPASDEDFLALWDRFGDDLVSGAVDDATLWAWWDRFYAEIDAVTLVRQLMDKGIVVPAAMSK